MTYRARASVRRRQAHRTRSVFAKLMAGGRIPVVDAERVRMPPLTEATRRRHQDDRLDALAYALASFDR